MDKPATNAFVFMISSFLLTFKEVVCIISINSINYLLLHTKVILGLEEIGLKVICIVSDNNAINVKSINLFMSLPERL